MFEDHRRRTGGRQQHVDLGQEAGQVVKTDRGATEALRDVDSPFPGAVRHQDGGDSATVQGAGQALTHLTSADHHDLAALQSAEAIGGHGHRGL